MLQMPLTSPYGRRISPKGIPLSRSSLSDLIRMKLEESLHEDTLSRVTFFDASNAPDFTVWAQDFTEGDSSVQILPLRSNPNETRREPSRRHALAGDIL